MGGGFAGGSVLESTGLTDNRGTLDIGTNQGTGSIISKTDWKTEYTGDFDIYALVSISGFATGSGITLTDGTNWANLDTVSTIGLRFYKITVARAEQMAYVYRRLFVNQNENIKFVGSTSLSGLGSYYFGIQATLNVGGFFRIHYVRIGISQSSATSTISLKGTANNSTYDTFTNNTPKTLTTAGSLLKLEVDITRAGSESLMIWGLGFNYEV